MPTDLVNTATNRFNTGTPPKPTDGIRGPDRTPGRPARSEPPQAHGSHPLVGPSRSSASGGGGLVIDDDGRVMVAGWGSQSPQDFSLTRLNSGGYGSEWVVSTDFSSSMDYAYGVAMRADGTVMVVGATGSDFGALRVKQPSGLEERIYPLFDANYNVTTLVSATCQTLERFEEDPQGKFTVLNGDFSVDVDGSDFGWVNVHQGGRFDAVVNGFEFRRRWLSVELLVWMSQDPIGFRDGMNRYLAYGNDPVGSVDPMGLRTAPPAPPPAPPVVRPGTGVQTETGTPTGIGPQNHRQNPLANRLHEPNVYDKLAEIRGYASWQDYQNAVRIDELAGRGLVEETQMFAPGDYKPRYRPIDPGLIILKQPLEVEQKMIVAETILRKRLEGYVERLPGGGKRKPPGGNNVGCGDPCLDMLSFGFGLYSALTGTLPPGYQANHLNQNAIFSGIIARELGIAAPFYGNAFAERNSPHGKFHDSLNDFFNQYRRSGKKFGHVLTVGDFDGALRQALIDAGCAGELANAVADYAKAAREAYGILNTAPMKFVKGKHLPRVFPG